MLLKSWFSATVLFGLAAVCTLHSVDASANLTPAQGTCYGGIKTATPDQRIAACTGLIAAEKPGEFLIVLYRKSRADAFVEKRECDRALEDTTAVIEYYDADAIENYQDSPDDYRNVAESYYARALIWAKCKFEFDRAIADYDAALTAAEIAAPALIKKKSGILDQRYMIHYDRATAWSNKGMFSKAIADLNESLRVMPKEENKKVWTGAVMGNRGKVNLKAGNYDEALADYSRAITLDPKDSSYVTGRAETWRLKGDMKRSLADHDKAIKVKTKDSESIAYRSRGDAYRYLGEFDKAVADYNRALSYEQTYASALTGRGLTYERMGKQALARADFEKAVKEGTEFEYVETARARLAALDSGEAPPVIPAALSKAEKTTSIPTPAIVASIATKPLEARAATASTAQGRRIALIIGNSAYKNVSALANPQKDAAVIAASLRNIGFDTVTLAADASREKLVETLRAFAEEAEKADWAMVYYAGHGIEVNGINYLIPVDAALKADRDVQFETVPLDQVMASVEGAKKLRIVMLDACRDNPFTPAMRRTAAPAAVAVGPTTAGGLIATRSVGRGLGEVKVSGASLVVYAAKHGQTALDGEGENSPFAIALVQRLATPGVEINKIFRLVRDDVMEATAGRQEPFTYGSLPGREDFFFVAGK